MFLHEIISVLVAHRRCADEHVEASGFYVVHRLQGSMTWFELITQSDNLDLNQMLFFWPHICALEGEEDGNLGILYLLQVELRDINFCWFTHVCFDATVLP